MDNAQAGLQVSLVGSEVVVHEIPRYRVFYVVWRVMLRLLSFSHHDV
jgi:hypothetical protein